MTMRSAHLFCFLIPLFMQCLVSLGAKNMDLYCGACKAIVNEVEYEIGKVDPKKMIEVGSYRLDPNGKTKTSKVSFARSESHVTDLLEKVCGDISSDYVQNKEKDGSLSLKRMVTRDGKMASDVDFQALMAKAQTSGDKPPDTDSKNVKFICEGIIEEHEEDMIKLFANSDKDIVNKICAEMGEYCEEEEESQDERSATKEEL